MPQSSHRDDFFQTDASIEDSDRKAAKSKNENGSPIRLSSKLLAIVADPFSTQSVYVAESAGLVRKLGLEVGRRKSLAYNRDELVVDEEFQTRETLALYRGPTAPVTSVAFSPDGKRIFAGCWDKTIWSWDVQSRQPQRRYEGHSDFVKTVTCARIGSRDVLISGGADSKIIVFDIVSGEKLQVLKDHLRGVQDLRCDPITSNHETIRLMSAGSEREIREYTIGVTTTAVGDPILVHETSVYKLYFDEDGDLWTASADKTAKCLTREGGWKPNMTLEHPDFVRDVVVFEQGGWVITACRDEEIRVWNKATGVLHHTFSGHYEEVTGLLLIGSLLVSVSIDATVRQWSLKPADLKNAVEEAQKKPALEESQPKPESMLTEEEERELAELMGEDE